MRKILAVAFLVGGGWWAWQNGLKGSSPTASYRLKKTESRWGDPIHCSREVGCKEIARRIRIALRRHDNEP